MLLNAYDLITKQFHQHLPKLIMAENSLGMNLFVHRTNDLLPGEDVHVKARSCGAPRAAVKRPIYGIQVTHILSGRLVIGV